MCGLAPRAKSVTVCVRARDAPPASPTRAINIELTRVHDDDPNSPVDGTDLVGEHKDVDVEVDLPTPEKPDDDDDDAGGDRSPAPGIGIADDS